MTSKNKHSPFSPSSAERFFNCPGSVFLNQNVPEQKSSVYAAEGSVAHSICEDLLINRFGCTEAYIGSRISEKYLRSDRPRQQKAKAIHWESLIGQTVQQDGFDIEITEEMLNACYVYAEKIISDCLDCGLQPHIDLKVEQGFCIDSIDPLAYGTCDCAFVTGTTIHIYDFKYGKGVIVEPSENKQLMYYALGALENLGTKKIQKVSINIIQPRGEHPEGVIRTWVTNVTRLQAFKTELTQNINRAKAVTKDNLEKNCNTGYWCRWCQGKVFCPAQKSLAINDFQDLNFEKKTNLIPDLTPEFLAKVLDKKDIIINWLDEVTSYAYQKAENGIDIPGYKLVEKYGNRAWKDETQAYDILSMSYSDDVLYTQKLISPAQAEKKLKLSKETTEQLTDRPYRGKVLVKDDSKRAAVPAARIDAVAEFSNVTVENVDISDF